MRGDPRDRDDDLSARLRPRSPRRARDVGRHATHHLACDVAIDKTGRLSSSTLPADVENDHAARLLARGDEVLCVDNLYTGRLVNLAHLAGARGFRFLRHDIIEPAFFDVDQIYNLACAASPRRYQHNPIRTIKTNAVGMLNVLGLANRNRARIVQASTSEVYGDPEVHPQREDYRGNVNSFGPRACYDEGKRLAEALCYEYREQHGVSVRVARI